MVFACKIQVLIATAITTALLISAGAYAGGGMGGGMGGGQGMMGGQSHGMMGSGGNGMMGSGQNFSDPWGSQPGTNSNYQYEKKETERLREEIKAKRLKLSDLYRSEKPNKEMIDQKITELDELEAKLDEKLSIDNSTTR